MITEDCDDTDNAAAEFTFTKQNFVTNSKLIQRCFVQTQKKLDNDILSTFEMFHKQPLLFAKEIDFADLPNTGGWSGGCMSD